MYVDFNKKILWTIIIVFTSFMILFPVLWTISVSLKQNTEIASEPGRLIPRRPTLQNYIIVWNSTPMPIYFKNSFFVAGLGALLTVTIAALAAVGFSRFYFKGRDIFFILLLAFITIPPLIYLIGQYTLLGKLGLLNSHLSLIVIYAASQVPITLWLLKNSFDQIPPEIDEAALIDGCSIFDMLVHIHIPLARSGIAGVLFLNFLFFWNEFIIALTLISSGSKRTVPVGINVFIEMYGISYGPLLASAIIASIPVLILFIILGRQFVEGLTEGAVKG